jgi:microcystin-dependent protein
MLFFQAAAPTGWTQYTAASDRALRVVSGTGGGGGGSIAFSTMFTGAYPVGSTAITEAQMPSHIHGVTDPGHFHTIPAGGSSSVGGAQGTGSGPAPANPSTSTVATGITINATGSSQGHDHTIPALAYADVIICTKN